RRIAQACIGQEAVLDAIAHEPERNGPLCWAEAQASRQVMREEPLRRGAKVQTKGVRGQLHVAGKTKCRLVTEDGSLLQGTQLQGRTAVGCAAHEVDAMPLQRNPYSIGEGKRFTHGAVLDDQTIKTRIARPARDRIA